MSELTRYPLCWPDNVARTPEHRRGRPRFEIRSIAESSHFLLSEIARLNNHWGNHRDERTIISTNLRLRKDGLPASDQGEPRDTGAAVYFQLRFQRGGKWHERPIVLTCDRWVKVSWNLYAMAKDVEAQRARERWGCGTLEQAYRGYLAIPERCGGASWWEVLGIPSSADMVKIKDAFRLKAQMMHPDKGGSAADWARLQEAYEQAMSMNNLPPA